MVEDLGGGGGEWRAQAGVLSTNLTTTTPSRIVANASAGVTIGESDSVLCGLTIQNEGGGGLASMSQQATVSGATLTTTVSTPGITGAIVKPAGSYTVQVVCSSLAMPSTSTFDAGDLTVVAAAQ